MHFPIAQGEDGRELFSPSVITSKPLTSFHVPEGSSAAHVLSRVLPEERHMVVCEWLFLRTLQYPGWEAEVSRGLQKNIQANKQRKREESRGWSQSNQLPHPKQRRNLRLDTEKSQRMNGHVKYIFS